MSKIDYLPLTPGFFAILVGIFIIVLILRSVQRGPCGRCGRKYRPPFWAAENNHNAWTGRPYAVSSPNTWVTVSSCTSAIRRHMRTMQSEPFAQGWSWWWQDCSIIRPAELVASDAFNCGRATKPAAIPLPIVREAKPPFLAR
jgi:hypothetical protein